MPKMKFTARGIAALKPPIEGRIEYWDAGTPGFGLRLSFTGARTWVALYRVNGRLRRHTLGTYPNLTLADAHEMARRSLNEAANGRDPAADKAAKRAAETFGDLAAVYLELHAKHKKDGGKEDERILRKDILPRWKNIKAEDVRRRDVLALLDAIVARGAPVQANRVLALVRKIFKFAISKDLLENSPCSAVELPTKPRSRDRILMPEEIRKVWRSFEQDDLRIATMFKLRLITAQRGGEIATMAWRDVDFETAVWTIPAEKAKNGLAHRVPLSAFALEVLAPLRVRQEDPQWASQWVFPNWGPYKERKDRAKPADGHIHNIQKAIQRIRSRACCGIVFAGHDLRRSAASCMASMGVPRLTISKILNHKETGVTAVYDRHSYDREKRAALEAWAVHLRELLAGRDDRKQIPRLLDGSSKVAGLVIHA